MAATGEDNRWRLDIGTDRKAIGDFAGLLHCLRGIAAWSQGLVL